MSGPNIPVGGEGMSEDERRLQEEIERQDVRNATDFDPNRPRETIVAGLTADDIGINATPQNELNDPTDLRNMLSELDDGNILAWHLDEVGGNYGSGITRESEMRIAMDALSGAGGRHAGTIYDEIEKMRVEQIQEKREQLQRRAAHYASLAAIKTMGDLSRAVAGLSNRMSDLETQGDEVASEVQEMQTQLDQNISELEAKLAEQERTLAEMKANGASAEAIECHEDLIEGTRTALNTLKETSADLNTEMSQFIQQRNEARSEISDIKSRMAATGWQEGQDVPEEFREEYEQAQQALSNAEQGLKDVRVDMVNAQTVLTSLNDLSRSIDSALQGGEITPELARARLVEIELIDQAAREGRMSSEFIENLNDARNARIQATLANGNENEFREVISEFGLKFSNPDFNIDDSNFDFSTFDRSSLSISNIDYGYVPLIGLDLDIGARTIEWGSTDYSAGVNNLFSTLDYNYDWNIGTSENFTWNLGVQDYSFSDNYLLNNDPYNFGFSDTNLSFGSYDSEPGFSFGNTSDFNLFNPTPLSPQNNYGTGMDFFLQPQAPLSFSFPTSVRVDNSLLTEPVSPTSEFNLDFDSVINTPSLDITSPSLGFGQDLTTFDPQPQGFQSLNFETLDLGTLDLGTPVEPTGLNLNLGEDVTSAGTSEAGDWNVADSMALNTTEAEQSVRQDLYDQVENGTITRDRIEDALGPDASPELRERIEASLQDNGIQILEPENQLGQPDPQAQSTEADYTEPSNNMVFNVMPGIVSPSQQIREPSYDLNNFGISPATSYTSFADSPEFASTNPTFALGAEPSYLAPVNNGVGQYTPSPTLAFGTGPSQADTGPAAASQQAAATLQAQRLAEQDQALRATGGGGTPM